MARDHLNPHLGPGTSGAPRRALSFPDWNTEAVLQLTGTARTDWDPARAAAVPGAERLVEFTVTEGVEIAGAVPLC